MATFLIYDRDNTHVDPVKDLRGCYKLGDIVEVFDDDRQPPLAIPQPPPFWVVKITGITKAQSDQFIAAHISDPVTCPRCDGTGIDPTPVNGESVPCHQCRGVGTVTTRLRRRLYCLDWVNLPVEVQTALTTTRYYETTFALARYMVRNKATGATV